jgi:hypothetical protein
MKFENSLINMLMFEMEDEDDNLFDQCLQRGNRTGK